jgi:hypothetical protein
LNVGDGLEIREGAYRPIPQRPAGRPAAPVHPRRLIDARSERAG